MLAKQEKENRQAHKVLKQCKGRIGGNVGSACQNLTAHTIESESDVLKMKRELQVTQSRVQDLTLKTKKQESRKRELEGTKATTERRLNVV